MPTFKEPVSREKLKIDSRVEAGGLLEILGESVSNPWATKGICPEQKGPYMHLVSLH